MKTTRYLLQNITSDHFSFKRAKVDCLGQTFLPSILRYKYIFVKNRKKQWFYFQYQWSFKSVFVYTIQWKQKMNFKNYILFRNTTPLFSLKKMEGQCLTSYLNKLVRPKWCWENMERASRKIIFITFMVQLESQPIHINLI